MTETGDETDPTRQATGLVMGFGSLACEAIGWRALFWCACACIFAWALVFAARVWSSPEEWVTACLAEEAAAARREGGEGDVRLDRELLLPTQPSSAAGNEKKNEKNEKKKKKRAIPWGLFFSSPAVYAALYAPTCINCRCRAKRGLALIARGCDTHRNHVRTRRLLRLLRLLRSPAHATHRRDLRLHDVPPDLRETRSRVFSIRHDRSRLAKRDEIHRGAARGVHLRHYDPHWCDERHPRAQTFHGAGDCRSRSGAGGNCVVAGGAGQRDGDDGPLCHRRVLYWRCD